MRLLIVLIALFAGACTSQEAGPAFEPQGHMQSAFAHADANGISGRSEELDLQSVMDSLEAVRANVRRDVLANKVYTPTDDERLRAIFAGDALWFQRNVWQDAAVLGAPELKENPGNASFPVSEVVSSSESCVWLRSQPSDDYVQPPPQITVDVVLEKLAHNETINPTPWLITQFQPVGQLSANEVCK